MHQGLHDVQTFDALGAPCGTNLIAGDSPDLFRIVFEEREVELFAEAINQKLLEIFLGLNRKCSSLQVTAADSHCANRTEIAQRFDLQANRIIEQLAQVVNPCLALKGDHDVVFEVRPGAGSARLDGSFFALVTDTLILR